MTNRDFEVLLKAMHRWESDIHDKKSADYAGDNDTLSNFKHQADICRVLDLPEEPWAESIRMLIVKLVRFVNLAKKGGKPKNESRMDTVGDGRQYFLLAEACLEDSVLNKKPEPNVTGFGDISG